MYLKTVCVTLLFLRPIVVALLLYLSEPDTGIFSSHHQNVGLVQMRKNSETSKWGVILLGVYLWVDGCKKIFIDCKSLWCDWTGSLILSACHWSHFVITLSGAVSIGHKPPHVTALYFLNVLIKIGTFFWYICVSWCVKSAWTA